MSLSSIDLKLDKIKKEYLKQNPKSVLIFVDEDNLPLRKVKVVFNNKKDIIECKNDKEWKELLNNFNGFEISKFINVKKPDPKDVAIAIC